MERKLVRNPVLAEKYKNITTEQATNCTGITHDIAHHFVSSKSKPDKINVVFDAGPKYSTSLNEHLLKRPDLLNNLVSVLMRFRLGEFTVVGDREEMFHKVNVRETYRDTLYVLYGENPLTKTLVTFKCQHIYLAK